LVHLRFEWLLLVAPLSVLLLVVSEPRGFGRGCSSLVGMGVVCRVLSRAALSDADIARTSLSQSESLCSS
jgi:hypothetical protein